VNNMSETIVLCEVRKKYRLDAGASIDAVDGVDLKLKRGDFLVVVGRSGSGKTTLLNLMGGLARPTAGTVKIDGADFWSLSVREQAAVHNQTIGFVFQFPSLMPSLTAIENVMLPGSLRKLGGVVGQTRAWELLDAVGLGDRTTSLPRQLSAGQQQRVAIARALVNEPAYLLADEPSSDLDEETEREMMALFTEIHLTRGLGIAMVTHARDLVSHATRAAEMTSGKFKELSGKWRGTQAPSQRG